MLFITRAKINCYNKEYIFECHIEHVVMLNADKWLQWSEDKRAFEDMKLCVCVEKMSPCVQL